MADEEKGNTTVDRATCVCICCSIVYRQLERSREGGISVARASFDGSGSVDGASEAVRNCAVAYADCGIRVAHSADGGIGVAEFSDCGCSIDASGSVDGTSEATSDRADGGISVACDAGSDIVGAHGGYGSWSVDGSGGIDDASEAVGYHAVGDANGGIVYGVDGYVGVARGSDGGCSIDGSGSVEDDSEAAGNRAAEFANGGIGVVHIADGAAGKALVVGIGVAFGWGGIEADGGGDKGACD